MLFDDELSIHKCIVSFLATFDAVFAALMSNSIDSILSDGMISFCRDGSEELDVLVDILNLDSKDAP